MYDKSKKTWSQRLKINKSEKSSPQTATSLQNGINNSIAGQQTLAPFSPTLQIHQIGDYYHNGIEFSPSALSRSMKYAEPWIYGTVRGIPTRSVQQHQQQQAYQQRHHFGQNIAFSPYHALFATHHPLSSELAVVVCSCPEYLTGTKREVKKASVCKKCKGSRLPLAPIGGTVRLRPTNISAQSDKLRATTAATLRVVSSASKSRPSILIEPQRDPYDLMRRSRLLSPEPKQQRQLSPSTPLISLSSPATAGVEKVFRNRTKNATVSPSRSRSRNRLNQSSITPEENSEKIIKSMKGSSTTSSSSASSPASNETPRNCANNVNLDCWLEESSQDSAPIVDFSHRRSILRCNLNPYDLISSKSPISESSSSAVTSKNQKEFALQPHIGNNSIGFSKYENVDLMNDNDNNDDDVIFETINHSPLGKNDEVPTATNSSRHNRISSVVSPEPSIAGFKGPMNYTNVKAIAGQRISLGENTTSSSLITQKGDGFMFETVGVVGSSISGEVGSSSDNRRLSQNGINMHSNVNSKSNLHSFTDNKADEQDESTDLLSQQPQRPPRRKYDSPTSLQTEASTAFTNNSRIAENNENHTISPSESINVSAVGLSQSRGNIIKSILKKPQSPASVPLKNSSDSRAATTSGTDAKTETNFIQSNHQQQNQKQLKRHSSSNVKLNTNRKNSKGQPASPSMSTRSSFGAGGSQFYLPLPQSRKKVQFMVEDRIIQASEDDETEDDGNIEGVNDEADKNDNHHSMEFTETDDTIEIHSKLVKTSSNYKYYNKMSRCNDRSDDNEQKATKEDKPIPSSPTATTLRSEYLPMNPNSLHSENAIRNNGNNNVTVREHIECNHEQRQTVLEKLQKSTLSPPSVIRMNEEFNQTNERKEQTKQNNSCSNRSRTSVAPTERPQEEETNESFNRNDSTINERKDDYDDVDLKAVFVVTPPTTTNPKTMTTTLSRNPIRRSNSERHPCNSITSTTTTNIINSNNDNTENSPANTSSPNVILNFKDTMALRMKCARTDSRDLFSNGTSNGCIGGGQNGMFRPRDPPPPPPTSGQQTSRKNENAKQRANSATTKTAEVSMMTTKDVNVIAPPLSELLVGKTQTNSPTGQPTPVRTREKDMVTADAIAKAAPDSKMDMEDTESLLERSSKLSAVSGLEALAEQQQQQHQPHLTLEAASKRQSNTNSSQHRKVSSGDKCVTDPTDCQNINGLIPVLKHNYGNSPNDVKATTTPANIYESFDVWPSSNSSAHISSTPIHLSTKDNGCEFVNVISGFRETKETNDASNDRLFVNNCKKTASSAPIQRTVVRVAPFNKTFSEIHRLKIKHSDEADAYRHTAGTTIDLDGGVDCNLPNQKKTSILISGDDCYSTVNASNDMAPLYQSSVVVTGSDFENAFDGFKVTTSNTVTINVGNISAIPRTPEEEIIYKNNKINTMLSKQAANTAGLKALTPAIIPICGNNETIPVADSGRISAFPPMSQAKNGKTLITLDYEKASMAKLQAENIVEATPPPPPAPPPLENIGFSDVLPHEDELVKILRNPVEAVKRNLVPHVCGKTIQNGDEKSTDKISYSENERTIRKDNETSHEISTLSETPILPSTVNGKLERSSFIGKLLEDPTLSHVAEGLDAEVVVKLIESSLKRLKDTRSGIDTSGTKDNDDVNRLIDLSLRRIKEEREKATSNADHEERLSNRGSISSANSFSSANNYEMFDFDANCESDCYQSCSSEITSAGGDDINDASTSATRTKFYQMLVDATLAEIEISTGAGDDDENDHHYESIRINGDPIYEEINEVPPPLPLSPPPLNDPELEKKAARSMFEGASKYDILSYLVDAKERGLVREESFDYNSSTNTNSSSSTIIEEESSDKLSDLAKKKACQAPFPSELSNRNIIASDSSDVETSLTTSGSPPPPSSMVINNISGALTLNQHQKSAATDIERNDSGVGSETSKSSRSKYQSPSTNTSDHLNKDSPIHLCEDCDGAVETQITDSGVMFAPLVCRKCGKKRAERKEIITEIVETEEKYGRDLQIILEEFCQPMLVAGLLTQEQLSAIFLNTEELLENNQTLAERMRDALDIALEQGDDDLLTVNIGKIFSEFTQMLHAFESYCVRQAGASLLLANLEKEKELLRIFLKVSQMENTVLRRMNLNSFLMVPVQRVTKYPLLLARLYKVTPSHLEGRDTLKQAQEKIELHLNHINQEAKDVPTKLWRRISSSSPNRRVSCEIDMINIKLRKMAIDVLEWNHDEVRFAMEGKLLYTQPTDSNWKKARTIKLTPVNALLVTNGKPSANYKAEKIMSDKLNFPKHTGIREASLLVVKEKCGRYTLIREPLYLDRCVVCTEADWDDYFEVQEIASKDTFIFKAEDGVRTKQWYMQLQYHAQGMGAWRKRRNALANIMINGMLSRT